MPQRVDPAIEGGMRRAALGLAALGLTAAALATAPAGAGPAPVPNAVSSLQGPVFVQGGALPGAGDSHAPESMSLESVILVDDRERVNDTTRYPNSAIGHLEFDLPSGGGATCTGFLVDADTVLTAGHCVHQGGTGDPAGWFSDVTFSPGRNGVGNRPFGSCGATELWTLPEWYDAASEQNDLGIIQLDCEIGETVGWLGYYSRPGPRALTGFRTHLRGYPGDKPYGTMWTDKAKVWFTRRPMIFYRNDTFGGQSGSPVFHWGRYCAGPCAMAVHAYGAHGISPHSGNNHGPRITTARDALIADIAGQNG
jgi:glutamyl endopeptidase